MGFSYVYSNKIYFKYFLVFLRRRGRRHLATKRCNFSSIQSHGAEQVFRNESHMHEIHEMPCSKRSRNRLTSDQAVAIYNEGPTQNPDAPGFRGLSRLFAQRYGVSPKTIRDIWNHRTWTVDTSHLTSRCADNTVCIRVGSEVSWMIMPRLQR
jgi:hypothetical protein